jgi:hypothetical protein
MVGHAPLASSYRKDPDAAPHAPQFQLLTGRGGRFLELSGHFGGQEVYPHMFVPDSCVGCHSDQGTKKDPRRGHSFKLLEQTSTEPPASCSERLDWSRLKASAASQTCATCHGALATINVQAKGDYDGNGRVSGIIDEIEGLMLMLRQEILLDIAAHGYHGTGDMTAHGFSVVEEKIVLTSGDCQPLKTKSGAWVSLAQDQPLLQKAAHNFLMILRDRSGGVHNPQYIIKLLQNSIEALAKNRGETPRHLWKQL